MEKYIQLSNEKAKQIYGKNPELDEILKENFTDEELGIKKPLPNKFSLLGKIRGFYINAFSQIVTITSVSAIDSEKNIYATKTEAESALVYAQLSQLMKEYNGNWKPNWGDNQEKFCITRYNDRLATPSLTLQFCFFAFPTAELRDIFLFNFKNLINTFYQIED